MNSPTRHSTSQKASISIDAWEEIRNALAPSPNPSPDRATWDLVAEQERLRIMKLLEHRLNIIGVRNVRA